MPAFSPDQLVVHIGPPRTGTTSLQFNVFAKHPEVRSLGKPFNASPSASANEAMAAFCGMLWKHDGVAFDFDEARTLWRRGCHRPIAAGTRVAVLSEEGLGHGGACDSALIAMRLRRLLGRCRVIITLRDPVDAALSYYRWAYARGFAHGRVDSWLAEQWRHSDYHGRADDFVLRNYRFAELTAWYRRLFGDERVLTLPLGWLQDRPGDYAGALAGFLGVARGPIEAGLSRPRQNESIGRYAAAWQRVIKRRQYARARRDGRLFDGVPPSRLALEGWAGRFHRLIEAIDRPLPDPSPGARQRLERYYERDIDFVNQVTSAGPITPAPPDA